MKFPPCLASPRYLFRGIVSAGRFRAACLFLSVPACLAASLWLAAACLVPSRVLAADPPAGWPAVTPAEREYAATGAPPADAVVLFETGEVDDTPRDGRVQNIHRRLKILSAAGVARSAIRISYLDPGQDLLGLEGRTITSDGRTVPLDAGAIRKSRTADGLAQVTFQLPGAAPGSIVEYRYTLRGGAPPAVAGWTFQHEIPCLRSSFTWHPSFAHTSHWTLLEADSLHPAVTPLTSEATPESLQAVRFEIRNLPAVPAEVMGPPEIETRARLVTTYTDFVAAAGDYWDTFARAAQERQDVFLSQIENLRAALLKGSPAPDDFTARIRLAYDFVQARARSAANTGGRVGPLPSTADSALAAGVGDPDGCDLLFIASLKVLGTDATRAFLVDRDQGFFHREIQTPAQFSRTLVAVTPGNGRAFFFSPGTPFTPPGVIPWYAQGITTLLAGSAGAHFAVTPLDDPTTNQTTRTSRFELDEKGDLAAAVHVDFSGQPELEFRQKSAGDGASRAAGTGERLPAALEADWRSRLPGVNIDSVRVSNLESRDRNVTIEARLKVERFGRLVDDRILFNPAALARQNSNPFPAGPRATPVYFDYPNVSTDNVTITLPAGWKLDALPDPLTFDNEVGAYRTFWSFDGEHVVYQRTFMLREARVGPGQYEALRALYDRTMEGDRALVALVPSPVRSVRR